MNDIRRLLNTLFVTLLLSASVCFVGVTFNGCGTPNQVAYKVMGTITVTGTEANARWQDYVVAGHATRAQDMKEKQLYNDWRAAMNLVFDAMTTADVNPNRQDLVNRLSAKASKAEADLVAFVSQFIKFSH